MCSFSSERHVKLLFLVLITAIDTLINTPQYEPALSSLVKVVSLHMDLPYLRRHL